MRAVLGKMELDDILAHRDAINSEVRNILDTRTEQWGVEISAVEIKDIQLPKEMQRAMARQAEAERERRAKVIAAEGEVQAAAKLAAGGRDDRRPPGRACSCASTRRWSRSRARRPRRSSFRCRSISVSAGGNGSPMQLQTMMQSAAALAVSQQAAKQLGAPNRSDQLEDGAGAETESRGPIRPRATAVSSGDACAGEAEVRREGVTRGGLLSRFGASSTVTSPSPTTAWQDSRSFVMK